METTPEDIHVSLWLLMKTMVESGCLACTPEIYEELTRITGDIGVCLCENEHNLILDLDDAGWPVEEYIECVSRMQAVHESVIAEYNNDRKNTVGLNDISIIALAKTLNVPLISMESSAGNSTTKRRIPDICQLEGVVHFTFNDMLRREGHRI